MGSANLPTEFLNEMEKLLGEEYPEFLSSYDQPRRNGLRVNRLKADPGQFASNAPFGVEPIPWADNGYYVDYRDQPARHPYYHAGMYYLQEPSAMAPAALLPVSPGDRILDLCAAPGGKATELGARLQGRGLLVANEISAARARALLRNIEAFGIANALVTNETPERLAERFPAFFDKVLVDAPCCGEGMFRKDPDVAKAWYPAKVEECAAIQRQIILQAADMLRPGGYMVYSTCTFAPEENELILLHLLRCRQEMELVRIPCEGALESFSPAYSTDMLRECGYLPPQEEEAQDSAAAGDNEIDLTKAIRIWPHRAGGEGHFTALLRKKGESRDSGRNARQAPGKGRRSQGPAGLSREEAGYLKEFLDRFLPGADLDAGRLENHGGKVYLSAEGAAGIRGITFLRNGLYLGNLKKNRFEPSQALAMALPSGAQGDERISFSPQDERLAQYLHGETVRLEEDRENGWYLVCADGCPLGWGKLAGRQLKNKLLLSWRV